MIQAKTLAYVLIMGMLTAACNNGGSSGGGNKPKPANPNYFGSNGNGGPPALAANQSGFNGTVASNNNGTKTVGMNVTTSTAALPGNTGTYTDPDSVDLTRPLTPTMYSKDYANFVPDDNGPQPQQAPAQQQAAPVAAPQVTATAAPVVVSSNDSQPPVITSAAPIDAPPASPAVVAAPASPPATSSFSPLAEDDPKWTPGVSRKPVTDKDNQIVTDPDSAGKRFSDSKADFLMAHFQAKLNGDKLLQADRVFANQITGVNFTRIKDSITVKVQVLEDGDATAKKLTLQGRLNDPANLATKETKHQYQLQNERKALLKATSDSKSNYHYLAHLICWDQNSATCNNSSIEIVREKTAKTAKTPKTNVLARAYVIYRLGQADLTIANESTASNPNQSEFDKYLLDSVINSCLHRESKADCPGKTKKADGAERILVKSWAVALGQAKFALIFQNDDSDTQEFKNALTFRGDLIISQHPVPMKVDQSATGKNQKNYKKMFASMDGAQLMADDGAGDMNIQVSFAGSSDQERFSVSTDFEPTVEPGDVSKLKQLGARNLPAAHKMPAVTSTGAVPAAIPGPAPKLSTAAAVNPDTGT